MKLHSGRPFSTRDKDPDRLENHCAKLYMGGWWYKNCYRANLNGLYGSHTKNQVFPFTYNEKSIAHTALNSLFRCRESFG